MRRLLSRSPSLRSSLARLSVHYSHRPISSNALVETSERLLNAWQSDAIPVRQRQLVEEELAAYRRGQAIQVFDALVDILKHNVTHLEGRTLLEVGCSSGYYSEVLRCRGIDIRYHGCDYSAAFIKMARELYGPGVFDVEDATRLSYPSGAFDILISGCCLLHIPEYDRAISEAVRVAKTFVVFHRTPVLHLSGPAFYTKTAYGEQVLEIHFNEQQLVRMFHQNGLQVIDVNTHVSTAEHGRTEPLFYKTYLCRKTAS